MDTKYNLDTIISKAIHRPIIVKASGSDMLAPLYTRVGDASETDYMAESTKNPDWVKASQANYNSPTNVRKLFIGDRYATIQYFQPPIIGGKKSDKCWYSYKLDIDEPLNILAWKAYNCSRSTSYEKGQKVSLTGTGLSALSAHWKMSNVEEIFITPSILLSETILNRFASARSIAESFINLYNGEETSGKLVNNAGQLALEIFEYANGNNIKNLRSRFPRLKTICFITNLDKLMEVNGAKNIGGGIPRNVSEVNIKWLNVMAKTTQIAKISSVGNFNIPVESSGVYIEFSVRPGIYRFDAEVLEGYFQRYKDGVLEIGRKNRDNDKDKIEDKHEVKSEYERLLEKIEAEKGQEVLTAILQLTFGRSNMEEINEAFNSMSSAGGSRYRKLLGR